MRIIEKTIKELENSIASVKSYGGGEWAIQNMIQDKVCRNCEGVVDTTEEASMIFDAVIAHFGLPKYNYRY